MQRQCVAIRIGSLIKSPSRSIYHAVSTSAGRYMSNFTEETVLSVHHWTDDLFSFTATRNPGFRFTNGQFTMMGLQVEGKPLLRAYSMVSTNYDEELEF